MTGLSYWANLATGDELFGPGTVSSSGGKPVVTFTLTCKLNDELKREFASKRSSIQGCERVYIIGSSNDTVRMQFSGSLAQKQVIILALSFRDMVTRAYRPHITPAAAVAPAPPPEQALPTTPPPGRLNDPMRTLRFSDSRK